MNSLFKRMQRGFTLIELVIVLILIAILASIAVPRYEDLATSAKSSVAKANGAVVHAAYAIYLGKNKIQPNLNDLAGTDGYVQGGAKSSGNDGVLINVDGTDYTVPTYTDTKCSTRTGPDDTAQILCVAKEAIQES